MAAKKKASAKKVVSRAKAAAKPQVAAAKKAAKKTAKKAVKKTAKKAVKEAQGLLGKLAQRSAQLIIDSGLLGDAPDEASPKKKRGRRQ